MQKRFSTVFIALFIAMAPPSAMAQSSAVQIQLQLEAEGYQVESVRRTWLGRMRIEASRPGSDREIVVNPHTGEILRDRKTQTSFNADDWPPETVVSVFIERVEELGPSDLRELLEEYDASSVDDLVSQISQDEIVELFESNDDLNEQEAEDRDDRDDDRDDDDRDDDRDDDNDDDDDDD